MRRKRKIRGTQVKKKRVKKKIKKVVKKPTEYPIPPKIRKQIITLREACKTYAEIRIILSLDKPHFLSYIRQLSRAGELKKLTQKERFVAKLKAYYEESPNVRVLAEKLGVQTRTVKKYLSENNMEIVVPKKGEQYYVPRQRKGGEHREDIIQDLKDGLSNKEICQKYNVSHSTVSTILRNKLKGVKINVKKPKKQERPKRRARPKPAKLNLPKERKRHDTRNQRKHYFTDTEV